MADEIKCPGCGYVCRLEDGKPAWYRKADAERDKKARIAAKKKKREEAEAATKPARKGLLKTLFGGGE